MKKSILPSLIFILFWFPNTFLAQTEPEDVAVATSEFENYFYESLKHKSMENYDKAIEVLEKCKDLDSNNAIVYFELGKNYFFDKKYDLAYTNFEKAAQIDPKNRWAWAGMYDVAYEKNDYNTAIPLVQKLIEFKEDYKEDLVSLYMKTSQFDKALNLINQLNETVGKSDKRELYKNDILKNTKFQGSEKENLIAQIKKFPKEESNYIQLIYLYSQSNEEEKANEIAKQLEKEVPTSDWVQVSLFKFYINNNEGTKAVKSMNTVLSSDKIDKKIKHRVLNEFLIFTKNNSQFEPDLDKAISYFDTDKEVQVAKEIGKFFQNKSNFIKAEKYYKKHLDTQPDDIETIQLLLQIYTDAKQYTVLEKFSAEKLELFPAQPEFYFYNGLANNQLQNYKKAKNALETGLDFVVDNPNLEINFNLQLGETSNGLGDNKKKESYFAKAAELAKKLKK